VVREVSQQDAKPRSSRDGSDETPGQGGLKVGRHFVIPGQELHWRFTGSGGPGGQHANTANTRVELTFDVATSGALGPRQRARLLGRLGPVVRIVASDERSQARNRELALQRLGARLGDALRQGRRRVPTVPTYASRERRRRDKQTRSALKRERRPPMDEP
jgi:ribosome-associated protein